MNAPTRDEFLARRKAGIGGSDIACMLGQSPYKTPLQLWMDKTGRSEDAPDPEAEERMYWGTVLEDVVARRYAEVTGRKVQRINQPLHHPEVEIALANIDRAVINPAIRGNVRFVDGRLTTDRLLEVKTAHALAQNGAEWGPSGSDEVPQHYWLQVQWYLGLSQCDHGDLAVLFGGQKFVTYTIERDGALFADLLAEADVWWKRHVVADMPPDATTEDDARRLWKSHVAGREKIVDATVAEAIGCLSAVKQAIKENEQREQELRDRILPAFGDAESISYMGRKLATWKANKASSKTDWKAAAAELAGYVPIAEKIIAKHTTQTDGARVLRLATSKE